MSIELCMFMFSLGGMIGYIGGRIEGFDRGYRFKSNLERLNDE